MYRRVLFSLIAVLALASAFSATSALASESNLCSVKANAEKEPEDKTCANAKGTEVKEVIGTSSGEAILTTSAVEIKCAESKTESKVKETKDSEVVLANNQVKFEKCKSPQVGACTVTINAGGETKTPEPTDTFVAGVVEEQKGKSTVTGVKAEIKCFGATCKVESTAAGDEGKGSKVKTNATELSFKEVPTVVSGFFCGTSGKETVTYLERTPEQKNEIWFASEGLKL